ncbi:MAG: hypothetical protein ACE5I3_14780 [Phycisphaerae bacterium]
MVRLPLATLIAVSAALAPQQAKKQTAETPTSQPASQPAARASPRSPRQAQIYRALLGDTERPPPKPILPVSENAPGVAEADASLLPEGAVLMERPGRLMRSAGRAVFHFKPGSPAEGAPETMECNKNGLLEAMEAEADAGVKEFIISAEVTRYRGRNYLNLLKYRRQVAHGNLGP